ncbi:hypothetical protein ACWGHM_21805 [Streptomyces sp. NPDC054904]
MEVPLLQYRSLPHGDGPAQAGPEVVVGGPLRAGLVEVRVVGRGFQPLREEAEGPGAGRGALAGLVSADVDVLVPPDVHGEPVLHFQPAPGTVGAEHAPDQLQADGDGHPRTVVVPAEVGWEEPGKAVSVDRRLQAEAGVDVGGDLRLSDDQMVDAGVLGEGGDRLQIRGLDRSVVAGRVLGADVAAVLVTICGVVLGDPLDERRHVAPRGR